MKLIDAAKRIWDLSLWERAGEPRDDEMQEAMLLAIWALMEQARFQEDA